MKLSPRFTLPAALILAGALVGRPCRATGQEALEYSRNAPVLYAMIGAGPLARAGDAAIAGLTVLTARRPVGISFQARFGESRADLPADYKPGLAAFGDDIFPDLFYTTGITGVWAFCPVPKVPALRLRVEAGPSFAGSFKNRFTPDPSASTGWNFGLNSNYRVERRWQQPAVGAEGAVRIEGLGRLAGLSAGVWGHTSSALQIVGVDFALLVGRCRP